MTRESAGDTRLERISRRVRQTCRALLVSSRTRFGLSQWHVLKHDRGDEYIPSHGSVDGDAVRIRSRDPNPMRVSDGVSTVVVTPLTGVYRVRYGWYPSGRMLLTRAGVARLGRSLLADRGDVPTWFLDTDTVDGSPPWWVPDDTTVAPRVECDECGERVPAAEVEAPGYDGPGELTVYCAACWDENRDEYRGAVR